ncbi:hypothetical protein ACLESD_19265 [Pyxidicoccus sp. 3LFB2]
MKGYVKEVLVDGRSRGRTQTLELPAGLHTLEVRGHDFMQPYNGHVTILAGEHLEQHVMLEPLK